MSKILINSTLKNDDNIINNKIRGIKSGKKLNYKENDAKVTLIINKDNVIIERLTKEYLLVMKFEDNEEVIFNHTDLKLNLTLDIKAFCKKLQISENHIEIIYYIEDNKNEFNYNLDIEVLE